MKKILLISLLIIISIFGCKPKEEIPMYVPDKKLYPGSAIIGNGEVCIVYSDDKRIFDRSLPVTGGIQQFYFNNFTASYIHGSSFGIKLNNQDIGFLYDTLGIEPFFSPFLRATAEHLTVHSHTFVTEIGLVGQKITVRAEEQTDGLLLWNASTLREIPGDRRIRLRSHDVLEDAVFIRYDNDITLAFSTYGERSKYSYDNGIVTISTPLTLPPGGERSYTFFFTAGNSDNEAIMKLFTAETEDLFDQADKYWTDWIAKANLPDLGNEHYNHSVKTNLYAARASTLKGAVPADLTGQYVTNGMPQLYPRDAMMTARMFIKSGYPEIAAEILRFWLNPAIIRKSPGEWYARYDAYGKPVDAGSGSPFDVPEWDTGAYAVLLQEKLSEYDIAVATKDELNEMLDFISAHIDTTGLLFEGGIVEWSGYLAATNMTAAAALFSGAALTARNNDQEREQRYTSTGTSISESLPLLFDGNTQTYLDYRPGTGAGERLWNTSTYFGILWGYPDHEHMAASNVYYLRHHLKLNGGMQYFDTPDSKLARYSHDCFFFTTSAASQYNAQYGDRLESLKMIHWMIDNANGYGLMPERIYLSGDSCSQASPLTWSAAEFVNTMLVAMRTGIIR
jgi:hypothetical protein